MNIKQLVDYNSVFGSHETNFSDLPWEKLNEIRSRIDEGSDKLNERVLKEQRDYNAEESSALKQASEFLTALRDEKDRRLANGSQSPIKDTPARSIDFGSNRAFPQFDDARDTVNNGAGVGRSYRELFHGGNKSKALDKADFRSFKEYCEVIHGGRHDERLKRTVHIEGTGALGGSAIPEAFAETIWTPALESSIVLPRAFVIPIPYGSSYYMPVIKNFSHVGGIYGVVPVWTAEAATGTPQTLTFGSTEIYVFKCLLYFQASNELISDGINIEQQITNAMRQALAWTCDTEFLTGSGVARPQGILNATSKVTVGRNTAGDLKYSDLCDMAARMYPACFLNSVWIVSVSVLPKLTQLVDAGNHSIWQVNAAGPSPGQIFGRPVILTEKTPALGSEGDVILADLSQYCIGVRKEISLDKSSGPGFMEDAMSYRACVRLNALPMWESAITPANGSDDLSWCVVLGS